MEKEEYTPPNHGKSIIEQTWDLLDETLAKIKASDPSEVAYWTELKGQAVGIAEVLAIMAGPWFPDRKSVTKEAVKRYKIAQGEIPFEQTPGYHYNPAPPGTPYPVARPANPQKKPVQSKKEATLSDEIVRKIKSALAADMPPEALAHAYKVTVQQVLSCK